MKFDEIVAGLIDQYGEMIMRDAVRHSANREDAEDAYQAALEVLLKKAPSRRQKELLPWLRTVVRNEAHHISRARNKQQVALAPEDFDRIPQGGRSTEDVAEAFAEIEMSFEALARLTADQKRCMVAHANGLEYDEIAELTGFTRRKVTRCLERGREAFARRLDAIAKGSECERMQPLIHRVLSADADAARELRPHLRHCGACRARMRAYESAPGGVAAMLGPAILITDPRVPNRIERFLAWWNNIGDRLTVQLLGADRWVEVATAKKAVAIVALASATASGGAAIKQVTDSATKAERQAKVAAERRAARHPAPARLVDPIKLPAERRRAPSRPAAPAANSTPRSTAPAASSASSAAPVDDGSAEFAPEGAP
jgi:RNA polymerase sigma factor (sigma-70 family)